MSYLKRAKKRLQECQNATYPIGIYSMGIKYGLWIKENNLILNIFLYCGV